VENRAKKAKAIFQHIAGEPVPWPSEEELADGRGRSMQRIQSSFFRKANEDDVGDADSSEDDGNNDDDVAVEEAAAGRGQAVPDDQAMIEAKSGPDSGIAQVAVPKPKRRTCDNLSESEQVFIATMAHSFMGGHLGKWRADLADDLREGL
jgi:hypothetical protein